MGTQAHKCPPVSVSPLELRVGKLSYCSMVLKLFFKALSDEQQLTTSVEV